MSEYNNADRAIAAERAVLAYAEEDYTLGETLNTVIQDLIGDLRHLFDRQPVIRTGAGEIGPGDGEMYRDWTFDQIVEWAMHNYEEEVAEEQPRCDYVVELLPDGGATTCDEPAPHCIGGEEYRCVMHNMIDNDEDPADTRPEPPVEHPDTDPTDYGEEAVNVPGFAGFNGGDDTQ